MKVRQNDGAEWIKFHSLIVNSPPRLCLGVFSVNFINKPLMEDEKRNQEILSRIPLHRWGLPEDLKGAVVFLASQASDYVTGTILRVDGRWLTR